MKKLLLISMLIGAMPLALMAQDDDLYFVPKKKKMIEETTERYAAQKSDAVNNDVIDFTPEQGVYPDSLEEDFKITKRMSRFDDYVLADSAAFWAGYEAGRDSWGWHSPFYYSRYGWYDPWYDPWYNPYYYTSWRYGWYDPWYYGSWRYGWYDPWYYGYAGWGWPYYRHYYPTYVVVGGGPRHSHIGTGTIRRDGSTGSHYYGGYRGAVAGNSSRMSSLRHRAESLGGSRRTSGNTVRSGSGNFSGYRGGNSRRSYNSSRSTGSFSGSRNSGSFGGGSSSRSSGGSFGGGGSRGGGGGGGVRMGGRR